MHSFLAKVRGWIDTQFLDELRFFSWHCLLNDSAKHVLLGGGKAVRPACLIWAHAQLNDESYLSKPNSSVLQFSLALEMIHTYSLVHDDLPAMDDDSFRRGRPTLHVLQSESHAILAGDALLTGAFELMTRASAEPRCKVPAIAELAKASGASGMIAGQVDDMTLEGNHLLWSLERLIKVHQQKTGALFGAAFSMAALLAGCGESDAKLIHMRKWGVELGVLFQIIDDILDVTSTREILGKSAGKDEHVGKMTYVSLLGLDKAKKLSQEKSSQLISDAALWMNRPEESRVLIDFFSQRLH